MKFICLITPYWLAPLLLASQAWSETLTVGPGRQFATPSAAAEAARDGDTVLIEPGNYYNCAVWSRNRLVVAGTGPGVVITDTTCLGKAIFVVTGNDTTIRDLTLARARVPDRNGAGVRLEGQGLILEHVRFVNDEVGLLSGTTGADTIRVSDCEFEGGGRGGERPSFAVTVGGVGLLRIERSTFKGISGGQINSAADRTELVGDRIATGAGDSPSVAVMATGGDLDVDDDVFTVGPNAPRPAAAILAMGTGRLRLRHDRMENATGQSLALLIDWSDTDPVAEDDKVSAGDDVVSSSGLWRHRAVGALHRIKDSAHDFGGWMKREVKAMLGR